jgi:hypothetical protein
MDIIGQRSIEPLQVTRVKGDEGVVIPLEAPARGAPADVERNGEELVVIDAALEALGRLVPASSFYLGWRATI